MEETILISESRELLHKAETALYYKNHEDYCKNMSGLLELLTKELVGDAPTGSPTPGPEQPAAEPEQPAAEPKQPVAEPEQPDKAKSDAAARRTAGNSPW